MTAPENQDWARKLKDLEAQMDRTSSTSDNGDRLTDTDDQPNVFMAWFDRLPGIGKLAAGTVAVLLALAALGTALRLIALLFSLAIFAGLFYVVYKLFLSSND